MPKRYKTTTSITNKEIEQDKESARKQLEKLFLPEVVEELLNGTYEEITIVKYKG